jgi:hypothetical protein
MISVEGSFQNGMAQPFEAISGRGSQTVIAKLLIDWALVLNRTK